jgi:hypothetical protein
MTAALPPVRASTRATYVLTLPAELRGRSETARAVVTVHPRSARSWSGCMREPLFRAPLSALYRHRKASQPASLIRLTMVTTRRTGSSSKIGEFG